MHSSISVGDAALGGERVYELGGAPTDPRNLWPAQATSRQNPARLARAPQPTPRLRRATDAAAPASAATPKATVVRPADPRPMSWTGEAACRLVENWKPYCQVGDSAVKAG